MGLLVALFFPIYGGATSELVDDGLAVLDRLTFFQFGLADLEVIANVLIFIPIGIFGAMLLPRRMWWVAVLAGAALSAVAELFQAVMLSSRVGSLRDVVLNVGGTLLGAFGTWVVRKVASRK